MIILNASSTSVVSIGFAGENESRGIRFYYPQDWLNEFPNGEIAIHVKRSGDGAVYQAQEVDDDRATRTVIWTITSTETSYSGRGEAQLCWVDSGVVVKSQRYTTNVEMSTAAVTPTDPPPDTIIEQAVEDYLRDYVDVITVSDHGTDGQILQSNGDGSYSWLSVDNTIVDSDTGDTLVPTRTLNRLARIIRQKTGYEGDMSVETMAEVLEQTDMWTTEEYCMNLAPAAAELTITLGAIPNNGIYYRQGLARVNLPYCGRIGSYAFQGSSISILDAPMVTDIGIAAFISCTNLHLVQLPKLVNIEGINAFNGCIALGRISLPALKTLHNSVFHGCLSLTEIDLPQVEINYGNSDSIDSVFNNCRLLPSVILPKFSGIIRTSWFDNCWLLQEAVFPKLSKITGNYNFRNCYALEKLYAPECTVWNGTQNFLNCNSLRRMCFYTKPTSISNSLFSGAPVLQDIYVSWSNGEVAGAPWGAPAGCTVNYDTEYDEDGEPIV